MHPAWELKVSAEDKGIKEHATGFVEFDPI